MDGGRIAFIRHDFHDGVSRRSLRTIRTDGTGERILFEHANRRGIFIPFPFPEGNPSEPHWSPDGRFVAFRRTVHGRQEVWRVNADGTGLRRMAGRVPPA